MIRNPISILAGAAFGAAAMCLFDPVRGNYRRALIRDQGIHFSHVFRRFLVLSGKDLAHRSKGMVAISWSRLRPRPVSDDILVARAASKIGRLVSNPHPIEITAEDGILILGGPIFEDEVELVRKTLKRIPGVRDVRDSFEIHVPGERISSLQAHRKPGKPLDILQNRWSPATKLLVGVAGGAFTTAATVGYVRKKAA